MASNQADGTWTQHLVNPDSGVAIEYKEYVVDMNDMEDFAVVEVEDLATFSTGPKPSTSADDGGDEEQIRNFIREKLDRANTLSATRRDVSKVECYLRSRKLTQPIQDIAPRTLNLLLCQYFQGLRKPDGSAYEPGTLQSKMYSIDR